MKISHKLLISFGFINLLIALSSALVYYRLNQINQSQQMLLAQALPALQRDEASQKALVATVSALRGYLILGKDPAQAARLKQEWEGAWQVITSQQFDVGLVHQEQSGKGMGDCPHRGESASTYPDAAGGWAACRSCARSAAIFRQ